MVEAALGSAAQRRNWEVIGALGAIALLSCGLLLHALSHIVSAATALANRGEAIVPGKLISALGASDFALMAATLGLVISVVVWEWRSRAISRLLATLSPVQAFVLLTLVVSWCGQAYLYPGVLLGGDTGSHIARFLEMRRGFEAGSLAQWTNYDYLGSPLLGFTGPFTYVVGGALDFVIRDAVITAKILLFATHLAAGWIFFAFLRRLDFTLTASLIAAIAFSCSFALLHLFLYRGVFPQQFTILFLVLAFHSAEGLMRGLPGRALDWLIFALATAGLVINHQPHALFVALYLALYGAASIALGRWHIARLPLLASAGAIGVAISAFAVLPIIVEADWVMIDSGSGYFRFQLPTLQRLAHLIVWRDTQTAGGIDYWAYVGFLCIALALLGGWAVFSRRLGEERRKLALALLPGLVTAFFVYNPVVRDVMFIVFFLGLFAALGVEQISAFGRPGSRLVLLCLVAVFIDVASTSVQPIARNDKQFMIIAGRYLEQRAANERFLEVDIARNGRFRVNIGPGANPVSFYSTVPRLGGVHNMAATRVHNYAVVVAKLAEEDLRLDRNLSADTETLLGLLNVSRVVCFRPSRMGCPDNFVGAFQEPPLGAVVRIPAAAPVIFSRTLRELKPPPGLDKPTVWDRQFDGTDSQVAAIDLYVQLYVQLAGIPAHSHFASALPVRALPQSATQTVANGNSAWHARVTSYVVELQRVSLTVASNAPGYAQLAHPWYRASEVRINDHRVLPIEGAFDLMVVPIAAGLNVIEIQPVTTPIRTMSAMLSGLALVLALIVAGLLYGRSAKSRPGSVRVAGQG